MVFYISKLYTFRPGGHGQFTFICVACTEAEARNKVDTYISEHGGPNVYEHEGWGTDYYRLEVNEIDDVITNQND